MKKIVIAGSAKIQDKVNYWVDYFSRNDYQVLDYPRRINEEKFMDLYPNIHKEFLENITKADMLFVMNEDKNGKIGYVGYEAFAELLFGLSQKLVYKKDIEIVIYKMPSKEIGCYEEIDLWLKCGWIKLFEEW